PVYPEFMPHKDDVLPAEEQPLSAAISPTTNSPGYITEFDPEEDPKEESSRDDADEEEDEEEEEEEHLALADSIYHPHIVPLLGCLAAMIWLRAELPSTSHSLPLPPPVVLLYTRASMVMMRAAAPST
nr:hypothetical protein [Tanacetum cinerariifolium]